MCVCVWVGGWVDGCVRACVRACVCVCGTLEEFLKAVKNFINFYKKIELQAFSGEDFGLHKCYNEIEFHAI